jgi:methyl-accepting chemotaxis protein
MKIGTRLTLGIASIILLSAIIGVIAILNIDLLRSDINLAGNDRLPKVLKLAEMRKDILRNGMAFRDLIIDTEPKTFQSHIDQANEYSANITKIIEWLETVIKTKEGIELLNNLKEKRLIYREKLTQLKEYGMKDKAKAETYLETDVKDALVPYLEDIEKLINYQKNLLNDEMVQANESSSSTITLMIILYVILILSGTGIGYFVTKSITKPVEIAVESADAISKGDFSKDMDENRKDEIGILFKSMNNLIGIIKSQNQDVIKLVNNIIDGKLDYRADPSKYQGEHAELIKKTNSLIDAILVPFNVTAEYVDRISKGDIPPKITDIYKGDYNEIKNNLNVCIDSINLLISDAKMLARAANDGKLDTRANATKHYGDFRTIVDGVNKTLDNVIGPLNIAAEYVDRISKGDIPPKITDRYNGDFNEIKNNLNQCIDILNSLVNTMSANTGLQKGGDIEAFADFSLFAGVYKDLIKGYNEGMEIHVNNILMILNLLNEYSDGNFQKEMAVLPGKQILATTTMNLLRQNILNLINDTNMLAKAAADGKLDARADAMKHNGDFRKIISGINKTLDNVIGPLNIAAEYVDRISNGDIPAKITDNYHGDFNEIKNNLNSLIDSLNQVTNIANEISKGNLNNSIKKRSSNDNMMIAMQTMTDAINSLITDSTKVASLATSGRFESRVDVKLHDGGYKMIVDGFNRTLDALSNTMNVTANIMVADIDGNITYMNESVKRLFIDNERSIRKTFSNFDAKNIIGRNFDDFHKNPSYQKNILKHLSGVHKTQITLGDDIFNLFAQKLVDSTGKELGYMVEWFLFTDQSKFEKGLTSIISDMTAGRFAKRIDYEVLNGNYQEIAYSINAMLDSILLPVQEGNRVLTKISGGDLSETFDMALQGDHKLMQNAVNSVQSWLRGLIDYVTKIANGDMTADINKSSDKDQIHQWLILMRNNIKDLISETKMLAQFALEGKLSKRAEETKHHGDFRVIVGLINKMMDLIVEPVNESISVLQALAGGDMTTNMVGDYKGDILNLKTALNDTVTSIHDILSQVRTTVEEVNSGSLQVSDASTSLSQGATEQAASLEEITSSMSEIGSQTKMNAENANHANILTNEAKVVADKGTKEMEQLNKAMKEINDSSKNISKIIKVIDEIAFQTNLLALNAAVEAARAGRHGKGFAVVAEEVRNLAARSATAAKETSDLIENSIKTVENGANLAHRTSDALTEIKQSSIKAADIVAEIATSSNEQAQAIAQINEGLLQIDKVTQTNTASAEESASASEQLSGQANQLKNMISRFILKDEYGYSHKMNKESTQRYISTRREASKRLTANNDQENIRKNIRPDDIINLDEDDFGRY